MKTITFSVIFLLFTSFAFSQNVGGGYSFEKYTTPVAKNVKKAKINYKSSKTAKLFRTTITESYNAGKIDFGGYYITAIWGCGTGCINGAMVDTRDGKVYDLPISEKNAWMCYTNTGRDEDRYEAKPNSRLFLTRSCSTDGLKDFKFKETTQTFIYVWNEQAKKFELKKTLKKSEIKKEESE